jgi:hypothetical protein
MLINLGLPTLKLVVCHLEERLIGEPLNIFAAADRTFECNTMCIILCQTSCQNNAALLKATRYVDFASQSICMDGERA